MNNKDLITTIYKFDSFKSENYNEVEDYINEFLKDLFKIGYLNKNKFRIITKSLFKKFIDYRKCFSHSLFFDFKNGYDLNLKIYTTKDCDVRFSKLYHYEITDKSNIDEYRKFIKNSIDDFIRIYDNF